MSKTISFLGNSTRLIKENNGSVFPSELRKYFHLQSGITIDKFKHGTNYRQAQAGRWWRAIMKYIQVIFDYRICFSITYLVFGKPYWKFECASHIHHCTTTTKTHNRFSFPF